MKASSPAVQEPRAVRSLRDAFLDHLASVHARTRNIVLCVPSQDIDTAPRDGWFTFGDLIRHLATIERWMYGETVQGRPSRYTGHGRELAAGYDDVVSYYDRLHEESRAIFAALSDEQLNARCTTPAGVSITTHKWLRAMLEHEAHHRGQLYLMLALRGVKTPPIYGMTSEELAAKGVCR